MKIKAKKGSAWHTWAMEGYRYRIANPTANVELEASSFANLPGWPEAGISARFRAFMEGAKQGDLQ